MAADSVILRFDEVTFEYTSGKPTLDEASFSVRSGTKMALMGQNGAGKTSLFKMITGELAPKSGKIFVTPKDATIGIARQVMQAENKLLSVRDYLATNFTGESYHLEKRMKEVLEAVNFTADFDKLVNEFSGGQQARLLLAHALMQNPDILLLDEPTNNLDAAGVGHLTYFLMMYEKTCIVISHDSDFLNAFTDGVLYLDAHTHKVEQYVGNYLNVVQDIADRVERERMQNARAEIEIRKKKEQAEFFAHKGGRLRSVAKRLREDAEEAEESKVEMRREDKPIRGFKIRTQEFSPWFDGRILALSSLSLLKDGDVVVKPVDIVVRKNTHLLISGPNGIGKTTLLETIARGNPAEGVTIGEGVKVGYYRQDFSTLDFDKRGYDVLEEVMDRKDEQILRSTASQFHITGKILDQQVKHYSEGQKGLLSLARLVLLEPGLLILDEPTNHMNFRHLPIIAQAFNDFAGSMILVSHVPDFVSQIRIDETLDLSVL